MLCLRKLCVFSLVVLLCGGVIWRPPDCEYFQGNNLYTFNASCPNQANSQLEVHLQWSEEATIICHDSLSVADFDHYLEGIDIGYVERLTIDNCPVPTSDFETFIADLEGVGVQSLNVKNSVGLIQPYHMHNLVSITELNLRGSFINGTLNDHFKSGFNNLRKLQLDENYNIDISPTAFDHLSNLIKLRLNSSNIKVLDENQFSELRTLASLYLKNNSLSHLPNGLFRNLAHLENLDISDNNLSTLTKELFDPLTKLSTLYMGGNRYKTLPADLFSNVKELTKIQMDINLEFNCYQQKNLLLPTTCANKNMNNYSFLQLPSTLFEDNRFLANIFFHLVPLRAITSDTFKDNGDLKNITMAWTMIDRLPANIFRNCKKLVYIDFSGNLLKYLPPDVFDGLNELRILYLERNSILQISDKLFYDITNLEELYLHFNEINRIDETSFRNQSNLKILQLNSNKLEVLRLPKNGLQNLEVLDISRNLLSNYQRKLNKDIQIPKLKQLIMHHNKFNRFVVAEFEYISNSLEVFDLSNNRIKTVNFENMTKFGYKLNIAKNPFQCDCFISELKQFMKMNKTSINRIQIEHQDDIKCSKIRQRSANARLKDVSFDDLLCEFPSEFVSLKSSRSCPHKCSCSWNRHNKLVDINCANRGLNNFPRVLPNPSPESSIHIQLQGNNISTLKFDDQEDLNHSNYELVERIDLSQNNISNSKFKFKVFPGLKVLRLENNKIHDFFKEDLDYFKKQTRQNNLELYLAGNPYELSCASEDLFEYVVEIGDVNVKDRGKIYLVGADEPLVQMHLRDFCTPPPIGLIVGILAICMFFVTLIVLLSFYIVYKDMICIWLYSKRWLQFLFTEDLIDADKPYDVFISYAHQDSDFVFEKLIPGLECEDNLAYSYKCLMHERDWLIGETITENIFKSVQSARRTVIVLSKHFINSMWSKLEFRAAHMQALQDKTQRVVIILLGELPPDEKIESELLKYIKSNTYIDSENPWFWQRLRYVLPHKGMKFQERKKIRKLSSALYEQS